jgi:hypothetical protein
MKATQKAKQRNIQDGKKRKKNVPNQTPASKECKKI